MSRAVMVQLNHINRKDPSWGVNLQYSLNKEIGLYPPEFIPVFAIFTNNGLVALTGKLGNTDCCGAAEVMFEPNHMSIHNFMAFLQCTSKSVFLMHTKWAASSWSGYKTWYEMLNQYIEMYFSATFKLEVKQVAENSYVVVIVILNPDRYAKRVLKWDGEFCGEREWDLAQQKAEKK